MVVKGVDQTSYAWTGTLAPSGIAPGILLGNYNFPLGTSSIAAWTSLPNGQLDSISQNDTATKSVIACNLLSGVFTVGDSTADYLTISDAVGAVGACGVSGPVTFNILPGVYNEQVSIPAIGGASAVNKVTFQSSTGNASDVKLPLRRLPVRAITPSSSTGRILWSSKTSRSRPTIPPMRV